MIIYIYQQRLARSCEMTNAKNIAKDTVIIYNSSGEALYEISDVIKVVVSDAYTVVYFHAENGEARKFGTNLPFIYSE